VQAVHGFVDDGSRQGFGCGIHEHTSFVRLDSMISARSQLLHDFEVGSLEPPDVLPEVLTRLVVGKEEDVALANADPAEIRQASLDQCSTYALSSARRIYRQVVKIAPTTIVATQDGTDDPAVLPSHEAQSRIATEIGVDPCPSIGVVIQPDALGISPQPGHFVVILDGHLGDLPVHASPPAG
jgi:hypothetical protein